MRTGRLKVVGVVLFVIALALGAFMVPAAMAATESCPAGGTKTESGSAGNSVVLAAGTSFCVKSSNEATGLLTADGVTTLQGYLAQEGITNQNGQVHDVSHYVVYDTPPPPEECPEGQTGTFPDCEPPEECPEGSTDPECVPPEECPEGSTDPECVEDEETPPDDVGGTRIDRPSSGDPKAGDVVAGKRIVKGRALPFTGIDPAPFIALSGLLAASGASALVIARRK
jgi:hypothetical protein